MNNLELNKRYQKLLNGDKPFEVETNEDFNLEQPYIIDIDNGEVHSFFYATGEARNKDIDKIKEHIKKLYQFRFN